MLTGVLDRRHELSVIEGAAHPLDDLLLEESVGLRLVVQGMPLAIHQVLAPLPFAVFLAVVALAVVALLEGICSNKFPLVGRTGRVAR